MIDFKNELNEAQYKAVTYIDGPELVIAGAGSGKTRVLTYKIAYLLENGFKANRILALTFTNKAAKEMQERISRLTNKEDSSSLVMGTFHGFCRTILANEIKINTDRELLPFTSSFTIYDKDDSEHVIKDIVEEMGLDDKIYRPSDVFEQISKAKNQKITVDQYTLHKLYIEDKNRKLPKIHEIYRRYQQYNRKSNAMDFDDLLFYTYLLFDQHENRRLQYAHHFQYVLVDEYQDTNILQKDLLLQLVNEDNKICVVGDDAQSIYAFRGAVIENILNYDKEYPQVMTFKLEQNYRSTQSIVLAANSLIKKNKRQLHKELFSKNDLGDSISILRCNTEKLEATYVVKKIKELSKKGYSFDDFTILYRSNWLSKSFEEKLLKANIPYKVYAATSFYQRKEVKDLLAYFRIVVNPYDQQALCRVINYPTRGIGKTTIEKLLEVSSYSNKSLWNILCNYQYLANIFPKSTAEKIVAFVKMVKHWQTLLSEDAFTLASRITSETGIIRLLSSSNKAEDVDRLQNSYQLLSGVKDYVDEHRASGDTSISLEDYLREISLISDTDDNKKISGPCVKMMTVHSSKGLEFPVVFVVGMDENVFPSSQSTSSERYIEEERRLFYVAITRAKEKCFLTGADTRFSFGKTCSYSWSRFVYDIDSQYIKVG